MLRVARKIPGNREQVGNSEPAGPPGKHDFRSTPARAVAPLKA